MLENPKNSGEYPIGYKSAGGYELEIERRYRQIWMLLRLTKTGRLKAGWCIALAYLFCVLAPSLSFAFADGSTSAPCIVEDHGPGMHLHEAGVVHHVHDGGLVHEHSRGLSIADTGMKVHKDAALPVKGPHKNADTRCCGLVSLSAIPAAEVVVIGPTVVSLRCETECDRAVADNAPPRHYRPPIS
jgi:hypothetical protein